MGKVKKVLGTGAVVVASCAVVAGCHVPGTTPQLNDLRNVQQVYPDHAETVMNVDGFPNETILCVHGTAIVTNTRVKDNTLLAPSLNAWCATFKGQHTS